ncbi:N-acetyltransferase [Frankia sp. Hr75.2]|nr:N-acetyltransferase [Frankia sp. Hr75.2]
MKNVITSLDRPANPPWQPLQAKGWKLSDSPELLDRHQVWRWLSLEAAWSRGRSQEAVNTSLDHSLTVGVYDPAGRQRGVARCVTDRVAVGFIDDVYVDADHRGKGVGRWLVCGLLQHRLLRGISQFTLVTEDAHAHYAASGFTPLTKLQRWMQWRRDTGSAYTPDPWAPGSPPSSVS